MPRLLRIIRSDRSRWRRVCRWPPRSRTSFARSKLVSVRVISRSPSLSKRDASMCRRDPAWALSSMKTPWPTRSAMIGRTESFTMPTTAPWSTGECPSHWILDMLDAAYWTCISKEDGDERRNEQRGLGPDFPQGADAQYLVRQAGGGRIARAGLRPGENGTDVRQHVSNAHHLRKVA